MAPQLSKNRLSWLLAVLAASCFMTVQLGASDSGPDNKLDKLFMDKPELKSAISEYLDLIPQSYVSKQYAQKALVQFGEEGLTPRFDLLAIGKTIGKTIGKAFKYVLNLSIGNVVNYQNILVNYPEARSCIQAAMGSRSALINISSTNPEEFLKEIQLKEPELLDGCLKSICDKCRTCKPLEKCPRCPETECSKCPPCPAPYFCKPTPEGAKCPPKPNCPSCSGHRETSTTLKSMARTTSKALTSSKPSHSTSTKYPTTTTTKRSGSSTTKKQTASTTKRSSSTTTKESSTTTTKKSTSTTTKRSVTTALSKLTTTSKVAYKSTTFNPLGVDDTKEMCICLNRGLTYIAKSHWTTVKPEGRDLTFSSESTSSKSPAKTLKPTSETSPATKLPSKTSTTTKLPAKTSTTQAPRSSADKESFTLIEFKNSIPLDLPGVNYFFSNLNKFVKDESLKKTIIELIKSIPTQTGGMEALQARRILAMFGEQLPENILSRASNSREVSYSNARTNTIMIFGHIFEKFLRDKCGCPECQSDSNCVCPKPKVCDRPIEKCSPCDELTCPAPAGCPVHKACDECARLKDHPLDDGDLSLLDDVDPVNPVPDGPMKPVPCKGFTCKFEKTCGKADLNPLSPKGSQSAYIVGGEDVKYGEFPSYAHVSLKPHSGFCGGVIISDSHVLTAGHCVRTSPEEGPLKKLNSSDLKVTLGEFVVGKKDEHEVEFGVKNICFASKFDVPVNGPRYDYAVLTLDKSITFKDHIQPACLPYKPIEMKKSTKCYIVGFGATGLKNVTTEVGKPRRLPVFAGTMQKLRIEPASCKNWGVKHDDRSRHCWTKYQGQGDTCQGDAGSPILCLDHASKRWKIAGTASYGTEYCDGTERVGWVSVYSRVPALLEDIQKECGI